MGLSVQFKKDRKGLARIQLVYGKLPVLDGPKDIYGVDYLLGNERLRLERITFR
jgi:hypothetical protein